MTSAREREMEVVQGLKFVQCAAEVDAIVSFKQGFEESKCNCLEQLEVLINIIL